MKYTKTIEIGLAFAFAVLLLAPQLANAQVNNALSLVDVNVEPNPVTAGSNMTVMFELYNSYDNSLKNINLEIQGAYPLLNFSPTGTYEISTIGEGVYPGFFTYTFHIPSTTPEGTYQLNVIATYETTTSPPQTMLEIGTSIMPITIYVYNKPNITINAEPASIVPGTTVPVSLIVANSGEGTARNIKIQLLNSTGFTVEGTSIINLGNLQAGQQAEAQANYYVSRNITNGAHTLDFLTIYTSDTNTTYTQTVKATISTSATQPIIAMSIADTEPSTLYLGYNQTVELLIQNIGSGTAKNVSVEISAGKGLQLMSSATSYFFGAIAPGQSEQIPVLVYANSSTSTQTGTITANITYYSANYASKYAATKQVALTIAPSAQFQITGESSQATPGATDVPFTVTIKNTGNEEATGVVLSLESIYPITPVTSTYYIASIAPGSSANATFMINVDTQAVPGSYPITIYEQWKQPNGAANQQYSGTTQYFAEVLSYSGNASETAGIVVVVVVIIALALAYYAKSKSRKKRKQ